MAEEIIQEELTEEELLEKLSEQHRIRIEKLNGLKAEGKNPYEVTKFDVTHKAKEIRDNFEALENGDVRIAGRITSWRDMGKANFIDIRDGSDRMQVYVKIDEIGEELFKEFKTWDLGDIVGVEGFVFKTRRGEISVHAKSIKLLSKSLLPLPEKWHGLKDKEERYRKRYLDLIANPEVKDTFVTRSLILREIRSYLDNLGYLEVDTPVLHTLEIGAAARPFVTHHNALDIDMYLRIETELYLKRLIVGGFDKVYEYMGFADSYFTAAIGAIPEIFFKDIDRDVPGWWDFRLHLDEIREELELDPPLMPSKEVIDEVSKILTITGFKNKIETIRSTQEEEK